jgi:hypothetical protein
MGGTPLQTEAGFPKCLRAMNSTSQWRSMIGRFGNTTIELVALLFWGYAFVTLFLYNIDAVILHAITPGNDWILGLKVLLPLVFLSVGLTTAGLMWTLLAVAYIIFYPLILVLWKLPGFVWRQQSWVILLSFINLIAAFFASFRRNVITTTLYGLGFAMALVATDSRVLLTSIGLLSATLIYSFISRFISVFKTPAAYRLCVSWVKNMPNPGLNLDDDLKVPVNMVKADKLELWRQGLYNSVLQSRLFLFAARKLKNYQNSGFTVIAEILITVLLLCGTVVVFAAINLSLFKLDSGMFVVSASPHLFAFLYYSFKTFVFSSAPQLAPAATGTEIASMAEQFSALMLVVIFASTLISVSCQRSTRELDQLIKLLEEEGRSRVLAIADTYRIGSVFEAIQTLEGLSAGTTRLLLYFSEDLDSK